MPFIGFPHSFLENLSNFWQKLFSDADQLESMYRGSAVLMGQAYLELLENVLNVSLLDTPVFNKEYFQLLALREDEIRYVAGDTTPDDRWAYALPTGLISFQELNNKVIEPSASLQDRVDYTVSDGETLFKVDPTDPEQLAAPLPGFARRIVEVSFGGSFDDDDRATWVIPDPNYPGWLSLNIYKGDTLRLLDVGPDPGDPEQKAVSDHIITLVREEALYVAADTALPDADPQSYVVLRVPYDDTISHESMTFNVGPPDYADLAKDRLVLGSVRVYAKRLSDGADVVEDVDYEIDYERGIVYKLTAWTVTSINQIDYQWMVEVYPATGGTVPRFSRKGIAVSTATERVTQIALWALDTLVDRLVLSNNFGALINVERDSSEGYRAFLRGVFQLYVLGPVLERIESAMNVILGLPVARDDGEVLDGTDTSSNTLKDYVFTIRPDSGDRATYEFAKGAPLRSDVLDPTNIGVLTFESFEPLTTGITVTDYVQDQDWWHDVVIPRELFPLDNDVIPPSTRRRANSRYIKHVFDPVDAAQFGDPGLIYGADESGFEPAPGHPIFRHRLAFVLMDRYLKFHTFYIRFDPTIFSLSQGEDFARSMVDLQNLVYSAKPAHTYILVQPATDFYDEVFAAEEYYYQPQRYVGGVQDQEIYETVGDLPSGVEPYVQLGLFLNISMGPSSDAQRDRFLFTDKELTYGVSDWDYGDYFRYEIVPLTIDFTLPATPYAIGGAPSAPRRRKIVYVFVDGLIGGKRLEENTDYTYDDVAETLTRLTEWDSNTGVTVKILHLNIVNVSDGPAPNTGDTALAHGNIDPANIQADYSGAIDWFGLPIPVENARDMSVVDRALQITVTPVGSPFSLVEPYRLLGFFT